MVLCCFDSCSGFFSFMCISLHEENSQLASVRITTAFVRIAIKPITVQYGINGTIVEYKRVVRDMGIRDR